MTLQEMYDKVMASDELKKSFAEAAQNKEKLEAWLKANGSDATAEQAGEFLKSKQDSGEVSDEELESVAGGDASSTVIASIGSVGIVCAVTAVKSAINSSAGECLEKVK